MSDLEIARELSKIIDLAVEVEAVRNYAKIYMIYLEEKYQNEAYWEYLSETKADFIDEKRLARHQQELEAEDEILGVRK